MSEPLKPVPSQIDGVVNVDRMDTVDRQKLHPLVKLQLMCAEASNAHGRDPRGGGFSIVGRPRVVLQLMLDLQRRGDLHEIKLERAIILGDEMSGADRVGWWRDVPIVVRGSVVDDRLYVVPDLMLPHSSGIDRRQASRLRVHAHNGQLEMVRD